jgi:lipopolysaccharide export system permease protein
MTMMLIRTLGLASQGNVNPSEVGLVLGFTMLGHLPTVLTMSLFIATVGTLSRMYLDSEMVIWFVGGRGLRAVLKPLLRFAWPMLVSIAVLVLLVWPWSNQQISELRERFERRGDLERVSPGQFQESANGLRVFFVDKESVENKQGKNVFIASTDHGKQAMTAAKGGRITEIDNENFLVLELGQRLEQTVGEADLKISEFKAFGSRIGQDVRTATVLPAKSVDTLSLMREQTRAYQGELSWRLGMTLAAINLVIIALAVTSANPRVGRGGNFALALFIFVIYYNFINLGQSWIGSGKAQLWPFMLALHGGALALAVLWLTVRHNQWSWQRLFKTQTTKAQTA